MNRSLRTCTLVAALAVLGVSSTSAFAGDSDTRRRTGTGAVVGGAVVGIATGSWGWAAAGAVVGGTGGYLYDKSKKNEEKAYDKGVQDGRSSK